MNRKMNPLTMRGVLSGCWLFDYRAPLDRVLPRVPAPLEAVSRKGFGFWNIVVCRVEALRPVPLPAAVGIGYWHVAYRIRVRARLASGQNLEGLFFVRSECDRPLMAALGNRMSGFGFRPARVRVIEAPGMIAGEVVSKDVGTAHFCLAPLEAPAIEDGSLFGSVEEAATVLKYEPQAFFPRGPRAVELLRVHREESRWKSRPLRVHGAAWPFLHDQAAQLKLCTGVAPIDYQWNRGEILEVAA